MIGPGPPARTGYELRRSDPTEGIRQVHEIASYINGGRRPTPQAVPLRSRADGDSSAYLTKSPWTTIAATESNAINVCHPK